MAASFNLSFTYDISYEPGDVLYFGINLLLGCREFPLRLKGAAAGGGGDDRSPRSGSTFNFTGSNTLSINDSSIFDSTGIDNIDRQMLYSDATKSDEFTFRMGSVALKLVVEYKPESNHLNDFFNDQFIELSNISLTVTIDGQTTTLEAKPAQIKLGKQHGEILLLSFRSVSG